jgi:glutaconate CoA-transferase subunit B
MADSLFHGAAGPYTAHEMMAVRLSRDVRDGETVACGANSPVPASALVLAKYRHAPSSEVIVLGSTKYYPFTGSGKQFFDFGARGSLDLFHVSGGEIDVQGNVNLHAIGDYGHPDVRLPGAFGTAVLYFVAGRINMFRNEHTRRSLVERVQFITCPANPPEGVRMGTGANLLVTPKAAFRMDRATGRFRLESVHPGIDLRDVIDSTGWQMGPLEAAPATDEPTAEELRLLRGPVADDLRETYPVFFAQNVLTPDLVAG